MARKRLPRPTDGEMEILNVLWDLGPCTVREANEALNRKKPTGYTTTLKLMQIMVDKGVLCRDESSRRHVYSPAISEEGTQKRMVKDLLDRVFSGSAEKLVVRALSAKRISAAELGRIKKLVEEMVGGRR